MFLFSIALMNAWSVMPVRAQHDELDKGAWNTGNLARLNVERVLFHPGLLTKSFSFRVDAYYTRPFGIRELDTSSVLVSFPFTDNRFGIAFTTFGSDIYSENTVALIHVFPLIRFINLTSELTWQPIEVRGFQRMSDISLSEGLHVRMSRLSIGFRFINLVSGGDANSRSVQSRAFNLNAAYAPSARLLFASALLTESGLPTMFVFENRLKVQKFISFLSEIGTNPSHFGFGLELRFKKIMLDYHLKQHTELGITSRVGVSFLVD